MKRCRRQPASLQPTPVLPTRTAAHRTAQTHLPIHPGAPFVVAAFPPRSPHRILACWKRCWAALRHAFSLSSALLTLARLLDLASTLPNRYAVRRCGTKFSTLTFSSLAASSPSVPRPTQYTVPLAHPSASAASPEQAALFPEVPLPCLGSCSPPTLPGSTRTDARLPSSRQDPFSIRLPGPSRKAACRP